MPNLSWEEISDIKHILQEAARKMKKIEMEKEVKYFQGLVELIDTCVGEHEDEV